MMRRDEISARRKPSSSVLLFQRNPVMMKRKDQTPLVDLCVEKAIDNVKYLGDVSHVDHHMLERILPHCTLEQLMHIEKTNKGMDLSPITDQLWKKFFEKQFGINCTNELYEAKVKKMARAENEAVDRLTKRYKEEDARKQSRQIKTCTKLPPSERRFCGDNGSGYNLSVKSSNIMKKSKKDFLNSFEVKNITAMKRRGIGSTSKYLTF
ncbi:RNA polymerase II transcription factor SIII (elongin) subunit A [Medicago truncatula]|uniref:RNA polymerase II transcription factor SIII (Elongin) subunit A n=1 Tax=Medicago truncatula TaxID=3880 RepID=A0A072TK47_MEDTR|nr:RNA polymerase II transcription factor SIII (elongin) subunit A [Medicago truncatula]